MIRPLLICFILFHFSTSFLHANNNNINMNALSVTAQKENKHLLLFFHKKGCSFCEKMINHTLKNELIANMIERKFIFVNISIDDDGSVTHHNFHGNKHDYARSLDINFYPTVGFVDNNNSIVYGAIGYRDVSSFSVLLEYIYGDHYKVLDLEDFQNKVDFEREDE